MEIQDRGSGVRKRRFSVLLIETECVARTISLLIRHRITQPRNNVGKRFVFGAGPPSEVYRETAMRDRRYDDLVLIVVRFRLRWIGVNPFWHALFRFESLFNTLLFAAHRGFETKLWLTDRETGYYRGVYEWRDRDAANEYCETLRVVLRPWAEGQSFGYEVIENLTRSEYLDHRSVDRTIE